MKLAVVVQRYGAQINGGAELHARYIVELLAKHHAVEVLTTCASNYVTWRNEIAEGTETLRGVSIRRFPVSQERDPEQFARDSVQVFDRPHSIADELAWLDSEGPTSPALIAHLRAHDADYDYVIFFSYRYYLAYHGVRAVSNKAILVPTAERDWALGLGIFAPIFRGVRALMYNSPEERAMIQTVSRNTTVPSVVVGVGSDVPRQTAPERFRQKYHLHDPFVLYVGRIDENKGCRELFSYFTSYRPRLGQRLTLVLIGNSILPVPKHSSIRHLGYVSDQDKFDALAAAELLAMPSYYESLSMVALEAWALGKPVLANGRCDVLRGQCIRSRAGLFYDTFDEFAETLFTLTTFKPLTESLGENGRRFYEQHYAWPVIERKYLDMLNQLAAEDAAGRKPTVLEPLPGWLMRRRKTLPAGSEVVKAVPHDLPPGDDRMSSSFASASGSAGASGSAAAGSAGGRGASGSAASSPAERDRDSGGERGSERDRGERDRGGRDGDRGRHRTRPDGRHRRSSGRSGGEPRSSDQSPSSSSPSSSTPSSSTPSSQSPGAPKTGGDAEGQGQPQRPRSQHRHGQQRRSSNRGSGGPGGSGSGGPGGDQRGNTGGGSGGRPRRDPNASSGSGGPTSSGGGPTSGSGTSGSGPGSGGGNSGGGSSSDADRAARHRRRGRGGRPGPRGPRGNG